MSVGILVPTYDGYADIWPIAAECFRRFWPERPWPIYWMTNGAAVPAIATPILRSPVERGRWGHYVASALDAIPEPLVLFWVEEILLLSAVPNDIVMEAAELLDRHLDIGVVQLTRYYIQPTVPTLWHFTDYPRGAQGFSAALPAIFRKEILRHLLTTLPKSNEFEQQSVAIMDRDYPGVRSLAPCVPMFRVCDNALQQGPWCACVVEHMKELGLTVDFSIRGIASKPCNYMNGATA